MSSIDYPPPLFFICLAFQTKATGESWLPKKKIGEATYLIIDHISDDQYEKVLQSHHLRLFLGCNTKEGQQKDFWCEACKIFKIGSTYYYCNDCNNHYHKECVESPPTFISPCYPKYPLQLLKNERGTSTECYSCGLKYWGLIYYSSTCDIFLDPICATKREFSTINNPKRHEHILHYFPRKASLTCDVCASDDNKKCFYSCLQCDFIVHGKCIDLPRVILISCHNHRLCFTNTLSFGNWSCGVCRRKIDENYGSYTCTKSCAYAVHTKCATRLDVWAGKELKDQPEMVYDDIEPFEEIGDGIIRHFSHAHHRMRLIEDIERDFDAKQQYCQACILSLYDGNVYTCMECDFVLHEACANLPRIKHIVVHKHRFILKPVHEDIYFLCDFCDRFSCGFTYMCEWCYDYSLDVRCASLYQLVDHPSHPHPLFLFYERKSYQTCSACEIRLRQHLNCVECDFLLCVRCANLPYKVKYEHDEHMLTLSYEKNASGPCWCQVCEETTDAKKGYYKCNECVVTFHSECLLGKDLYMKAGKNTSYSGFGAEIIPNNRLSRSICKECKKRCQYKIVFITSDGDIFCSGREILGIK